MPDTAPTIDGALIGAAGVHFVASELSLRGLIALPTIRNTAGIDIVVVNRTGTWHANLQVKTSRSKVIFWPIGQNYDSWCNPNNYYVFVRYLKNEARFEVFLETSERVAEHVAAWVAKKKEQGLKGWAPCWHLQGEDERLWRQWVEFGPRD
jgi:lysine/ornithine N-monooxygenase